MTIRKTPASSCWKKSRQRRRPPKIRSSTIRANSLLLPPCPCLTVRTRPRRRRQRKTRLRYCPKCFEVAGGQQPARRPIPGPAFRGPAGKTASPAHAPPGTAPIPTMRSSLKLSFLPLARQPRTPPEPRTQAPASKRTTPRCSGRPRPSRPLGQPPKKPPKPPTSTSNSSMRNTAAPSHPPARASAPWAAWRSACSAACWLRSASISTAWKSRAICRGCVRCWKRRAPHSTARSPFRATWN